MHYLEGKRSYFLLLSLSSSLINYLLFLGKVVGERGGECLRCFWSENCFLLSPHLYIYSKRKKTVAQIKDNYKGAL